MARIAARQEGSISADLWELRASKEPEIDVTVPTDRRGDTTVRIRRDRLDPSETSDLALLAAGRRTGRVTSRRLRSARPAKDLRAILR